MKHLSVIILFVITLATIGNAQDVITTTTPTRVTTEKVAAEIIPQLA